MVRAKADARADILDGVSLEEWQPICESIETQTWKVNISY